MYTNSKYNKTIKNEVNLHFDEKIKLIKLEKKLRVKDSKNIEIWK
jgi:hypothetical protein